MKRLIIFVVCLCILNRSFAQISIIPELGYNSAMFYTNAPSNQIVTSSVTGFQGGVLVSKHWFENIFLQTGLQFSQKGSYQGRGYQALYGSNTNIQLSYLQLPLNIGGTYLIHKNWKAVGSAGLYGALGLSGTETGSALNITGTTSVVNNKVVFTNSSNISQGDKTYIKPLDIGYNVSAGISFHDFLIKSVFSRGFGNASAVGTTLYKNQVLNFSLGYICRID